MEKRWRTPPREASCYPGEVSCRHHHIQDHLQLTVSTATLTTKLGSKPTLKLDFILDYQGFALVVNFLVEFGGDSVVSGLVLHNKALVADNGLENVGLLDSPFAHVRPILSRF